MSEIKHIHQALNQVMELHNRDLLKVEKESKDEIDKLINQIKSYEKMLNCTYEHMHISFGPFICSKCGWISSVGKTGRYDYFNEK